MVATGLPSSVTVRFGRVDPQREHLDRLLLALLRPRHPGAPQRRLHARAELAHRERLGDVVVGAQLEPEDLVDLLGLGGEHDDRDRGAGAQPAAHLEAVHLGQHHVQHDEVEGLLGEARERLAAVRGLHHLVPVALQREGQQRLDRLLVVDQEDARGTVRHTGSVDTVHNVLDLRVYRAAFIPALLALFVVAFSLQGRPSPARTRAIADAFDPARAFGTPAIRDSLLQLGAAYPDRRPGSSGDAALADRVGDVLGAAGFDVARSTEEGRTVDGPADLETVVGVRPGRSSRRIVVLAHRDALGSPGLAELSGTAALLELARIFRTQVPSEEAEQTAPGRPQLVGRDLAKTLVLVSTSGGTRRRRGGARLGARPGGRRHRRRAGARRPRLGGVAQAVGRAVVERARAAAARLAAHGRDRGAPGDRRGPRRLARDGAMGPPRAARDGRRAGRGEPRRAPRRAAAGQRRARAGAGRARLARALHHDRAARRCGR